jgi:hypothetical protein
MFVVGFGASVVSLGLCASREEKKVIPFFSSQNEKRCVMCGDEPYQAMAILPCEHLCHAGTLKCFQLLTAMCGDTLQCPACNESFQQKDVEFGVSRCTKVPTEGVQMEQVYNAFRLGQQDPFAHVFDAERQPQNETLTSEEIMRYLAGLQRHQGGQ